MDLIGIAHHIDAATEYSFKWYQDEMAQIPGERIELLQENAILDRVEPAITSNSGLIVFYDHGNNDRLVGYDTVPVIDLLNVSILNGREIYTMACLSAQELGKRAVQSGCKSYWGYTDVVTFDTTHPEIHEDSLNYGLTLRVKDGLPWAECVKEARDHFLELIASTDDTMTKIWLSKNLDALVCYGEGGDVPKETPACKFSRFLRFVFGDRILWYLRKVRERLFGVEPGWP